MAAAVGGAAVGLYELCALAAAAIATLFVASPQGQKASQEAARKAAEALEKLRQKPEPEKDPKPFPLPPPVKAPCPQDKEKEKCPVCSILLNPTPGRMPAYVTENRAPRDPETLPPLTSFKRTEKVVKQARVWRRLDGTYVHRDTFHKGKGAELENYDSKEKHTGTTCPHCGAPRGPAVPGRRLPD